MVKGNACGLLVHVLSHTGDWAPHDRDLWRAKGLAVTCLGNIVEQMSKRQLFDYLTGEMIDAVVPLKESEDAPLGQKGQAICTLAANRWAIQPHYREERVFQ